MTPHQAEKALADAEVVPCAEMQLADARRLVDACPAEGVPALVHREACSKPSCSPKFQVLVRTEDVPRVAGLLQQRWLDSLQREDWFPRVRPPGAPGGRRAAVPRVRHGRPARRGRVRRLRTSARVSRHQRGT
ncbi:hypothetical protein ACN28S_21080 [Cystobacter fuscus]